MQYVIVTMSLTSPIVCDVLELLFFPAKIYLGGTACQLFHPPLTEATILTPSHNPFVGLS